MGDDFRPCFPPRSRDRYRPLAKTVGELGPDCVFQSRTVDRALKPELTRMGQKMNTLDTMVLGIDISKARFDVAAWQDPWTASFDNNKVGFKRFIKAAKEQFGTFIVGLEPTGGYERDLVEALLDEGIETCFADARRVRHFATAYNVSAKTDVIDARFIARFVGEVGGRVIVRHQEVETLADIMAARAFLVEQAVALEQKITSIREPNTKRMLERQLRKMRAEASALQALAISHVKTDDALAQKYRRLMTAPGVGPIVALTLLAEVPELGHLTNKQVARLIGVAPFTRESGQWKGRATCQGGRTRPRNMIFLAAMAAKRHNKASKAFVDRLLANAKPKMVAINALMRKIITHLNAMLANQSDWNEKMAF